MLPTSTTADHAATAAPMMSWPRPWATFAVSVARMPKLSSHRARTDTAAQIADSVRLRGQLDLDEHRIQIDQFCAARPGGLNDQVAEHVSGTRVPD